MKVKKGERLKLIKKIYHDYNLDVFGNFKSYKINWKNKKCKIKIIFKDGASAKMEFPIND